MYFIVKETRREKEARLEESRQRSVHRDIRGVVRATEEAYELSRQDEREGRSGTLYAVSVDAPESKQAEAENLLRAGINPDGWHSLHSDSTRHGEDHSGDIIGKTLDGKPLRAADLG